MNCHLLLLFNYQSPSNCNNSLVLCENKNNKHLPINQKKEEQFFLKNAETTDPYTNELSTVKRFSSRKTALPMLKNISPPCTQKVISLHHPRPPTHLQYRLPSKFLLTIETLISSYNGRTFISSILSYLRSLFTTYEFADVRFLLKWNIFDRVTRSPENT